MNKSYLSIIGFLFVVIGFTAFILGLVGVRFTFLAFLDSLETGASMLAKIILILIGFILVYIGKTSPQRV